MPKNKINYEDTIMYKLCCKDVNITPIYIGQTTNFTIRKSQHKSCCKNDVRDVYKFIREHGGFDNWNMIEIEKYPCKDSNEALRREEELIRIHKAELNMVHNPCFKRPPIPKKSSCFIEPYYPVKEKRIISENEIWMKITSWLRNIYI